MTNKLKKTCKTRVVTRPVDRRSLGCNETERVAHALDLVLRDSHFETSPIGLLTPAQSAQEALDTQRKRYRSSACLKEPGLEKQEPTPDAVTVLRNEDKRRKVKCYRTRKGL
jgi:hypothetical protein